MNNLDRHIAQFMGEMERLIAWKIAESKHETVRPLQVEYVLDAMSIHLKQMFLTVITSHSVLMHGEENDG